MGLGSGGGAEAEADAVEEGEGAAEADGSCLRRTRMVAVIAGGTAAGSLRLRPRLRRRRRISSLTISLPCHRRLPRGPRRLRRRGCPSRVLWTCRSRRRSANGMRRWLLPWRPTRPNHRRIGLGARTERRFRVDGSRRASESLGLGGSIRKGGNLRIGGSPRVDGSLRVKVDGSLKIRGGGSPRMGERPSMAGSPRIERQAGSNMGLGPRVHGCT